MASSKVKILCSSCDRYCLLTSDQDTSASRPISQGSLPPRQNTSRPHSHSVSLSAMNASHRISRRKSMTSNTATNAATAAMAAALREGGDRSSATSSSHRRSVSSRKGLEPSSMGNGHAFGSYSSRPYAGSNEQHRQDRNPTTDQREDSAVVEGGNDEKGVSTKNRNRRASEGSHLTKGEGKRHGNELKCDTCGKGYKHSSCLTKHLYVPQLAVTPDFVLTDADGSMIRLGLLPPNCSSQNISKSSCWKLPLFLSTCPWIATPCRIRLVSVTVTTRLRRLPPLLARQNSRMN